MRNVPYIRVIVIALLVSVTASGLTYAGQEPALVTSEGVGRSIEVEAETGRSLQFAEIESALTDAEAGEVRVIVQLDTPSVSRGFDGANGELDQRQAITMAQGGLLSSLPAGTFSAYAQFNSIPFVALKVNRESLAALEGLPDVVHIQEDVQLTVSLDSTTPIIGAGNAWSEGYTGDGQTVVIIDTGVDADHPFFGDRVVAEACFSNMSGEGGGTSLCPNGEPSQIGDGASDPKTDVCLYNGTNLCVHGTHVAGIASGNGDSFDGVAPDSNIVGVQVFTRIDDFQCIFSTLLPSCVSSNFSDILLALEHVYDDLRDQYSIASINMSLGGEAYSDQTTCDEAYPSMTQMIKQLKDVGIATVIATGNNGYTDQISVPGCISHAVSVGSTDDDDTIASYSNMHPMVELMAPGSQVTSAVPGTGFESFSGTSMATPHVAGAWAVMKERFPNESVDQILNRLISTGVDIGDDRAGGVTTKPRIDLSAIFGANLELSSDSFAYTVTNADEAAFTLTMQNSGASDLDWSLAPSTNRSLQQNDADEIRLTHSLSRDVLANNSTSCASGQSFMRVFDLAEMGVTDPLNVTAIEFGIESSFSFIFFPPTIEVRLYTMEGDVPALNNLTQIGKATGQVNDYSLQVISAPISQEVPANSKLVVELYNPAPLLLESVVFGSNNLGQTGPTYYHAPGCDVNEITDAADLGFPDMHLVMEVVGEALAPPPSCNEWIDSGRMTINPTSGTIVPSSQRDVAINVDVTGLEPGQTTSHLCLETNTASDPIVYIPITIDVPCPEGEVCEPTPTPSPTSPPTVSPTPTSLPLVTPSPTPIVDPGPNPTATPQPPSEVPQAQFSASPGSGTAPLSVAFTNQSTGNYFLCTWDMGDGTEMISCDDVTHTYTTAGEFTVSLTVNGLSGSHTLSKDHYIVVADATAGDGLIFMPLIQRE